MILLVFLSNCGHDKLIEKPPLAKIEIVTDNYFGTDIQDPYRYMENLQDTMVQNWFKDQADYSRSILERISGRQSLIDKMVEFNKRESSKVSRVFITSNDKYFYEKETPNDKAPKLMYKASRTSEETILFDPNTYG
jgi:prolyl oligopeptidase